MSIHIDLSLCKGCAKCVKLCPFAALSMKNGKAVCGDNCTGCGACMDGCPFGAISADKAAGANVAESGQGVWVFAEQRDGALENVAIELLGEGKKLADQLRTELCAVLCGKGVGALAQELIRYGADRIYLLESPDLEQYTNEVYCAALYQAIEEYKPEIVLFGATHIGRDLAPSLAAKCETGLTADCTGLKINEEDGNLHQTRPAFGGNLMATIVCPNHRPQMATVRPGVMEKPPYDPDHKGEVVPVCVDLAGMERRVKVIEVVKDLKKTISLTDADIIVAGGLGLGGPEGFELLWDLAGALGGTIAATRACVDAGWIDHSYQVGQTGTTVRPTLYIACGVSGAIQHLAGMQGSRYIVAINKNSAAPIFEAADYGIVGDLYEVIPHLMAALKK